MLRSLLFSALLCGFFSMQVNAQTSCQDAIASIYGTEKMQQLQQSNGLDYQCFKNSSGFYYAEIPASKQVEDFPSLFDQAPVLQGFELLGEDNFENIGFLAAYGIEVLPNSYQYFRVGNTDTYLVVYPDELIRILYEKQ